VGIGLVQSGLVGAEPRALAQSALAQLGLTEATARTFLFDEVKAPAADRTSPLALTGTRAFLKLPASARAGAATALFAWAKVYANSPAFQNAYAQHRKNVGADSRPALSVDEEVKKKIDDELARLDEMRQQAAAMSPELAARTLEAVRPIEQNLRSPETANAFRMEIEASRARQNQQQAEMDRRLPADPQQLFARRLREFLDATADVNFAARTASLNEDANGIVFLDRPDRKRHWIWQEAVIVGPEATAAARAAAQAWLKEIER
jgi:hypothetical protein